MTDTLPALSPTEAFREKISARIRADIGDLMPDEMISKLVADAIHAELYRDTRTNSYGQPAPWIRETVSKMVSTKLTEAIQVELAKAESEVAKQLRAEIAKAVPAMIGELLLALLKGQAYGVESAIITAMNRRG